MRSMFAWFETLPLWGNTAIMAALSALIALAYPPIRSGAIRWALALLTPFALAWAVFSTPVWKGVTRRTIRYGRFTSSSSGAARGR